MDYNELFDLYLNIRGILYSNKNQDPGTILLYFNAVYIPSSTLRDLLKAAETVRELVK